MCAGTFDDELALVLHGGGLVVGDAGVVAVVDGREVGDAEQAGELVVVDGDAQVGRNGAAVLLPGEVDGVVARDDHAGDEHALADGVALHLKGLDVGRFCGQQRGKALLSLLVIISILYYRYYHY